MILSSKTFLTKYVDKSLNYQRVSTYLNAVSQLPMAIGVLRLL